MPTALVVFGLLYRMEAADEKDSNVEKVWALRHMDDFLFVGKRSTLDPLLESLGNDLLLRDVQFLENPRTAYAFWVEKSLSERAVTTLP